MVNSADAWEGSNKTFDNADKLRLSDLGSDLKERINLYCTTPILTLILPLTTKDNSYCFSYSALSLMALMI